MTDHFPDATKKVLSPAAQAVLTAATQKLYCLDPEDVPLSASEYGSVIAAALRAVADQVVPTDALYARSCCEFTGEGARAALLAIADELENS